MCTLHKWKENNICKGWNLSIYYYNPWKNLASVCQTINILNFLRFEIKFFNFWKFQHWGYYEQEKKLS